MDFESIDLKEQLPLENQPGTAGEFPTADKQGVIQVQKSPFNRRALFSDESPSYRTPPEPEENDIVRIKFRAEKNNVDAVYLVAGCSRIKMDRLRAEDGTRFEYFQAETQVGAETLFYYFEIQVDYETYYYDKRGVACDVQMQWCFGIVPGFHTPEWAKGAVIYQIFVDRFYNGDPSNDVEKREYIYIKEGTVKVTDWNRYPAPMDVREFYGGDLAGVMEKLDYLKGLGVDAIYFNPLFVSPSNHKYDIQDYDYIDPHFGVIVNDGGEVLEEGDDENIYATKYIERVTDKENLEASNRLFVRLVEEIHARGMKVILDGVFNHCGSFNKWLDGERIYENEFGYEKGAYISGDSPYRSFFKFNNPNAWPYNKEYDGWWGHSTLPKLNYEESPTLCAYILEVGKKWVSPPFNVDGWRLDVAADLGHSSDFNHKFWQMFRNAVKEANPEALIVAEHYGNPRPWMQGDQWDTVMNYDAFMEPITWFLTGMEKHSDEYREELLGNADSFECAMINHMADFYFPSLVVSMNELSNHDHSRFLTRTNRRRGRVKDLGPEAANIGINKGIFREAVVMQMTWPGAPTIYYGDEAGVCGFTDPDNRRTYPWGREDYELIEFHREIIRIHKENKVLVNGSIKILNKGYNVLAYGRFDEKDQIIVVFNNNPGEICIEVQVWETGIKDDDILEQIMGTTEMGYSIGILERKVKDGKIALTIPKVTSLILRKKR